MRKRLPFFPAVGAFPLAPLAHENTSTTKNLATAWHVHRFIGHGQSQAADGAVILWRGIFEESRVPQHLRLSFLGGWLGDFLNEGVDIFRSLYHLIIITHDAVGTLSANPELNNSSGFPRLPLALGTPDPV